MVCSRASCHLKLCLLSLSFTLCRWISWYLELLANCFFFPSSSSPVIPGALFGHCYTTSRHSNSPAGSRRVVFYSTVRVHLHQSDLLKKTKNQNRICISVNCTPFFYTVSHCQIFFIYFIFIYILFYIFCAAHIFIPAHRYGTAELCFHHVLLIAQLVGEDQSKKITIHCFFKKI